MSSPGGPAAKSAAKGDAKGGVTPATAPLSPWSPFRHPLFRTLWGTWFAANLCMWMNDVTAAWLMTTLTTSPVMVALVQAAATFPMFVLGVPSGALADIVDRRRYLIFTYCWLAVAALLLCLMSFSGLQSPLLLLVLSLANGIGLAMRWPVSAALISEVVPRPELPAALGLNAISMNTSRILGPLAAGALIAAAGSSAVFLLNAVLCCGSVVLLLRWQHVREQPAQPAERLYQAIRLGLHHVRQSPAMRAVLLRIFAFTFVSVALSALLPLVAKGFPGGGARTYTLLVAAMGGGAILMAFGLPRVRQRLGRDGMVRYGTLLHASATVAVALAPNPWFAGAAMALAGMGFISTANSLTVAAQMVLPDWVRARGMAIYQVALMGGSAFGALLWGQVASFSDVQSALLLAGGSAFLGLVFLRRVAVGG